MDHLQHAIDAASYMPHGYCLLWKPWLVAIHAASDALIFVAYTLIPLAILLFIRRREIEFSGLAWLFIAFIFLCGVTHLVNLVTLWFGIYETQGWIKLLTALVSIATAAVIFPLIPKALAIPTPEAYEARLAEKNKLADELRRERNSLEYRVAERTEELKNANAELQHRCKNLLAVVSATARFEKAPPDFSERFGRKLAGLASSLDLLTEKNWGGIEIRELIQAQILAFGESLKVTMSGPSLLLKPSAVQYLGMALTELATNAVKHNPAGEQSVAWSIIDDEALSERLRLVWSEKLQDGVLRSDAKGTGTNLLDRIVPAALFGTAELIVTDAEVVWALEAPIEHVRLEPIKQIAPVEPCEAPYAATA